MVLAYLILALIFTFPAATRFQTHIIGDPYDSMMFIWTLWWPPHALFSLGRNPMNTNYIYYPEGTSLVFHTHVLFPALVSAPFQYLFGPIVTYNLLIIASFVLSGLAMYLLVREISGNRIAAFLAGIIFSFGHFRVSMIVFINLIHLYLLVFFIWSLIKMYRTQRLRWALLSGAFAVFTFYTSYNLFVFLLFTSISFFIYCIIKKVRQKEKLSPFLKNCGIALAVFIFFSIPLFISIIEEISKYGDYGTSMDVRKNRIVPLARWFVRGPLHGQAGDEFWHHIDASFLGYFFLICLVFSFIPGEKRKTYFWYWFFISAFGMTLALGSRLNLSLPPDVIMTTFNELKPSFPLPYKFVKHIPLFNGIATPHRFGVFGWIGCSVMAGIGLSGFFNLLKRKIKNYYILYAVAFMCALFIMIDYSQIPFPIHFNPPEGPPALLEIRKDPRDVCVLEITNGRMGDPRFPYYETVHKKPAYKEGSVARPGAPRNTKVRENSFLYFIFHDIYYSDYLSEIVFQDPYLNKEIEESNIGWIILSWDRWRFQDDKSHGEWGPKIPGKIEKVDYFIRKAFSIEDIPFSASDFSMKKWIETKNWLARREMDCIYRVYKVKKRSTDP